MIKTIKTLWEFCEHQHKTFAITLIMSLVRAFIGVTQFMAIMLAVDVIINDAKAEPAITKIIILAVQSVALLHRFTSIREVWLLDFI